MMLATTTVKDVDQFLKIYATKGADKRRHHGSKGSTVFRDPNEDGRVWVIVDWDAPTKMVSSPALGLMTEPLSPATPLILNRSGVRKLLSSVKPARSVVMPGPPRTML